MSRGRVGSQGSRKFRRRCIPLALLAASLSALDACATEPELTVAIQPDIPPYVMENAGRGLEVEIVRRALAGYTLHFIQMPYGELQTAVPKKRAKVAVAVQHFSDDGVFYSNDFMTFENYAITRKPARLTIDRVAELANHKVLAWQDAYLELGPAFERLFSPGSAQRKNYVEYGDQREQVRVFWAAPADVIVIDRSIFRYYSVKAGHSMSEVAFHSLFPPVTSFKIGFEEPAVRDAFNRGLAKLCKTGEYAKLLEQYHIELQRSICN